MHVHCDPSSNLQCWYKLKQLAPYSIRNNFESLCKCQLMTFFPLHMHTMKPLTVNVCQYWHCVHACYNPTPSGITYDHSKILVAYSVSYSKC